MRADKNKLAARFHEAYERLAPQFGYETRPETRAFDPTTPNGRLMLAVCDELSAYVPDEAEDTPRCAKCPETRDAPIHNPASRMWRHHFAAEPIADEADTPRATPNLDPERARMAFAYEPESLSVGRLNRAVRDLREEIYHLRLRLQAAEPVSNELNETRYVEWNIPDPCIHGTCPPAACLHCFPRAAQPADETHLNELRAIWHLLSQSLHGFTGDAIIGEFHRITGNRLLAAQPIEQECICGHRKSVHERRGPSDFCLACSDAGVPDDQVCYDFTPQETDK